MPAHDSSSYHQARRPRGRRAFSLLELAATLAIVALLAVAGAVRWGSGTLENLSAEQFARKLALDLHQARRRTIATGDNHYLQMTLAASKVTGYSMFRRTAGGDAVVEQSRTVPTGVTATTSHSVLEFDFEGAALGAYTVNVAGPTRAWTVATTPVTGDVQTSSTP